MNAKERFDAIQRRATLLVEDARVLKRVAHLPPAHVTTEEDRRTSFVACRFADMMEARAAEAVWSLRKAQAETCLPDYKDGDYDQFDNRVIGIAGALGLTCAAVADGFLTAAEFILDQAEEPKKKAKALLDGESQPQPAPSSTPFEMAGPLGNGGC